MDTLPMENKLKQPFIFVDIVARFIISFFVALFSHSFHLICFYVILAQLHHQSAVAQHAPAHHRQQIEVAPAQPSGIGTPMPMAIDEYMPESDEQSTGRLNQFQGFYTPRPLPAGAQFTFASVWATWSAWSFCSGGVQMRVRACNTVRGFSCLGPNREVQPCEELRFHPSSGHKQRFRESVVTPEPAAEDEATNIYRVNDPWAEDRQEAMRQLTAHNTEQPVQASNSPSIDQMPAQNAAQQNAEPTATNLGEPVNVKQGGTLKQIKDSIQLAQQQYWALSGQHGHMGTVEWGGGTKNHKQQNVKKMQQQQTSYNSEDISPKALSSKIEMLTPAEKDNLAKQLVDIEDRLQKTEPKLQQNQQKPATAANSIATGTVIASSKSLPTVTSTAAPTVMDDIKAEKTVEDITREWWKEKEKHGGEQQQKRKAMTPGRQQLHSDGGQKAVVEELTESDEFVASSAEEMPSNLQMWVPNPNGGGKKIAAPPEIGSMQSSAIGTPARNGAIPAGTSISSSVVNANGSMTAQNKKRPAVPITTPPGGDTGNKMPTSVVPVPKYHQAVQNLTGRPLDHLDARQRTIVAVLEQQKRKTFRKEGDLATSTVPSAAQMPKTAQKKKPEQTAQRKFSDGRLGIDNGGGQLSADTAQALEWMLANMSKSVEVVQQSAKVGSKNMDQQTDENGAEEDEENTKDRGQNGAVASDDAQNRLPSVVFPSKQLAKKLGNPTSGSSAAVVVRPALATAKIRGATGGDQFAMAARMAQRQQHSAKNGILNLNSRAFAPGKPLRIGPGWEEEESDEEAEQHKDAEAIQANAEGYSPDATSTTKALERHRKRIITELARAQNQRQSDEKKQQKQASPISMEREIGRLRAELRTMERQMGKMRGDQHGPAEQPQKQQQKDEREMGGAKGSGTTPKTTGSRTSAAADAYIEQKQVKIPASSPLSASGSAARGSKFGKKLENSSAKLGGKEEEDEEDYEEDESDDDEQEKEGGGANAGKNDAVRTKSALSSEKYLRGLQKWQPNAKGGNGTATGTNYEVGPLRIGEAMVQPEASKATTSKAPLLETTAATALGRLNSRNIGNEVTTNVENENSVWTMLDGMGSRHADKAQWTDWGPWGECICGKQMRSRVCHYEQHSNGCSGRSYEVRHCAGAASSANCPTTRAPVPPSRRFSAGGASDRVGALAKSPNGIIRLRHLLWRRSTQMDGG